VGFEVEIADALARRLGVRAEFVQNDWSMLVPSLERGDFDVAMNGIEVTDGRRGRVAFSRPYYVFTETLVVRRGDRGAETLGDLRGRRVGTLEASLAFELLSAVQGLDVVRYEGVEEPYLDLERRRLDAVLLDNIIAARYGLPRPTLQAAGTFGEGTYAIAIRPADETLVAAVDGALAGMRESAELRTHPRALKLWDDRQARLGRRGAAGWHGSTAHAGSPVPLSASSSAAPR
jgi:polar amino acid transport system substrate-binding protein